MGAIAYGVPQIVNKQKCLYSIELHRQKHDSRRTFCPIAGTKTFQYRDISGGTNFRSSQTCRRVPSGRLRRCDRAAPSNSSSFRAERSGVACTLVAKRKRQDSLTLAVAASKHSNRRTSFCSSRDMQKHVPPSPTCERSAAESRNLSLFRADPPHLHQQEMSRLRST